MAALRSPGSAHEPTPWIVAVGASGGEGLDDLMMLLAELPSTLSAVVMVVLHQPWDQQSYLYEILSARSSLPVIIAAADEHLKPGIIYIGEPSRHLTLAGQLLSEIVADPGRQHRNRTVDLLFKSVAAHAAPHAIGVVLSGTLDDGARGLAAIHDAGGLTMVLTPSTPPRDRMPDNAIGFNGPITLIGNLDCLARGIALACAEEP
jgi:two-component system, chemotaxis family, protein-glutamate methylesterase/glutaminase